MAGLNMGMVLLIGNPLIQMASISSSVIPGGGLFGLWLLLFSDCDPWSNIPPTALIQSPINPCLAEGLG